METFIIFIHIFTCALLVLVVLIQAGKGAEISASFSGSSQTVFGSSGGANFFTRFTAVLATIFMVTSITLTVIGSKERKSIFDKTATAAPIEAKKQPADAKAADAKAADAKAGQKPEPKPEGKK